MVLFHSELRTIDSEFQTLSVSGPMFLLLHPSKLGNIGEVFGLWDFADDLTSMIKCCDVTRENKLCHSVGDGYSISKPVYDWC